MGRGARDATTGAERPDPLNEIFWVSLSDRAAACVDENAERIFQELRAHADWAVLNCDLASEKWLQAFQAAGVDAVLAGGNYNPSYDDAVAHPGNTDHTWLLVEGRIFDPTAGQFAHLGRIEESNYYAQ